MCGRITQYRSWEEMRAYYDLFGPPQNLAPRYNLPPTDPAGTIRLGPDGREHAPMRWWLVPRWWKKPLKSLPPAFNARAEGVARNGMFRDALRERRCIVWADGFYEWKREGKDKTPFYLTRADGAPLSLAGLWESWTSPEDGERIRSCTVITCPANATVGRIHGRMPVVLERGRIDDWLTGAAGTELLVPCPDAVLGACEVSSHVNNWRNDDPRCIEPASGGGPAESRDPPAC